MTFRLHIHLEKLLKESCVEILTSTNILEVTDQGITASDKYGKQSFIEADTVVLATGFKPNRELAEELRGKLPEIYEIGDCVNPRKVINAIW